MELREALGQIAEIRARLAEGEIFRGYRALPVAFSGLLAVGAMFLQPRLVPAPVDDLPGYLALWVGVAALSVAATGLTMCLRDRFGGASDAREITRLALGQFVPCLLAGGLVTAVLVRHAPASAWMLPGLWQVFFSLGVFASCRLLPRATASVGGFYLLAGLLCLSLAQGERALAPWAMGLPFGVGQLSAAAVLYWTLERRRGPTD